MARTAGKKSSKPGATTTSSATSANPTVKPSSPSTSAAAPPAPFTYAASDVKTDLLSTLPISHVYLTHVDTNPIGLKRRVFLVPVLLNILILGLLACRAYYAAPTYLALIITVFGYDSEAKVDTEDTGVADLMSIVGGRTMFFLIDYALFSLLGSWPWEFCFGSKVSRHVGPLQWRLTLGGFRDTEIIIRRSRKWDESLAPTPREPQQPWTTETVAHLKTKIASAMNRTFLAKTGYLMLDRDWDLDFAAMLDAHRLVDQGTLQLSELNNYAFVHHQKQWLAWHVHDEDDPGRPIPPDGVTPPVDPKQDAKVTKLKSYFISRGHEELFYRYIELVQFESAVPGGFTKPRQDNVLAEMRKEMESRDLDYESFIDEVGGRAGLPGME